MTPSVSNNDASVYYNAVACCQVDGDCSCDVLQDHLKHYEISAGRVRGAKNVLIDLDLVVFDGKIVRPVDFSRNYFSIGYRELNP